ncbi:hypothetical protein [Sporomusa sp. KB1]|jgi:hypothetical protein|uniref:hypothetical protein n=1 Tax=Sporomusa sp. KB1 TaxID=943346 RepID=UPI0011A8C7A8|nr:hypothetical protein [Sporomusa sp. KB1]TWH48564.1 hypothetical protein Salpa_4729 [Sporomusa sp. KB1]
MAVTSNLGIPLLEGSTLISKDAINTAFKKVDQAALAKSHADSGGHWATWQAEHDYVLRDIIRTDDCYSWGYLECITAGTSGTTAPDCPYGAGDTVIDGTVVWTLRQIGSGGGGVINHKDLAGKSLPDQHPIGAITGLQEELDGKASKVEGKGLSTNDYDDESKAKVDKIIDENGRFTYDGEDFYTKSESDTTFVAIADYQDQRSLTFVGSNRTQQYPWSGQVQLIQVNYTEERTSDINFWVEKQYKSDFEAKLDAWQKIGGQILNLPLDKIYMEYAVTGAIAAGDMIRLTMPDDDPNITVQVSIFNDNNF